MPKAVRLGDICTGHADFQPRVNDSASKNVFINGKGSHRVGDHWVTHCNTLPSCHDSTASGGSPTVFVNGKPKCRVGDSVACGSRMASGSGDVFIN